MKKIPKTALTGELGVNLIQKVVLEMGCMWNPTGGTEAGIDGTIEIVDAVTNEATNQVLTVQSKATSSFLSETADTVEFICKERDLAYWMRGNTPVILVYSKPVTGDAYWVSIKDYFADPKVRATRKIRFNKQTDRFDSSIRNALERIIVPKDSGLYLGTPPRQETLHSDLVPLRSFPSCYYTAPTQYGRRMDIIRVLQAKKISLPGVWIVRSKIIYSLDPLDGRVWADFCDQGAIERHEQFEEWGQTDVPEKRRNFVELLNLALKDQMYDQGLLYDKNGEYFFERPNSDLTPKELTYTSRTRKAK